VRADDLVSAGGCSLPAGSYSFLLLDWFLLVVLLVHADEFVPADRCTISTGRSYCWTGSYWYALTHRPTMVFESLVKQFWATATVRTLEVGPSDIITTIDGNEVVVTESLIRTQLQLDDKNGLYEFTLHDVLDGMRAIGYPTDGSITFYKAKLSPQWSQIIFQYEVELGRSPYASFGTHVPPEREHSPVREHSSVREPSSVRDPTLVREPSPRLEPEPTPDSPSPLSPPPSSAEVGPTTSSRPPSPSRPPSSPADIREGGGTFASSPPSNESPQTLAAMAAGGAEDSATLTALTLKLDECLHRVTTLENKLGITKKAHQEAVYFFYAHVSETIPPGVRVPAVATTISAASSVDATVRAATAPSLSIPIAADKGKAPMVDDSPPANLLSEQERVLKNLYDSQLGEELAKKIQAEQEAKFARQHEELAQKTQAESVASPTAHGQGMSNQYRRELDAAQLIYSEADWLDLLAKIATNSALSKQLLGNDVTEENMNKRLGMILMRKRRELAEQSRVKPMTKTQQRDYMRDFVKNCSASVYNQGWTMKKVKTLSIDQLRLEFEANQVPAVSTRDPVGVPAAPSIPADASLLAASSSDPTDIPVPVVSIDHAAVSVPAKPMVHSAASHMDDPLTDPAHGSSKPTVAAPTPSSSHHRRKHIAKKRVTPIVDVADAAMIKFNSDSDDDPLPYAPYAGWEMVPSSLGSVHAYHNMAGHTKHFTTLREILHMVERTDLQRLLGAVDALYQSEEPDTFALLLIAGAFAAGDYIRGHKFMFKKQMALSKDKSNPLIVGSLLKTTWSSIHHLLTNEVLTSPEQTTTDRMLLSHDPVVLGVPAGFVLLPFVPAGSEHSHSCCCVPAGKHSFCCQ
nr:JmjC domain-containing protein [Tanacetum cinerariifolium]